MKTYSMKPAEVTRKWYLVDASEVTLGRLSTAIATLLLGKRKPEFTPHVDGGDYVVVVNAAKLKVTGGKETKKIYYTHSDYPSGLKSASLAEKLNKDPASVITLAVKRMLPDNKLRDGRLKRLKVYAGSEHNNTAQQPQKISVKEGL